MTKRGEKVANRVKRLLKKMPAEDAVEGVQPLNPGYFVVERLRMKSRPKQRDAFRAKINGRDGR